MWKLQIQVTKGKIGLIVIFIYKCNDKFLFTTKKAVIIINLDRTYKIKFKNLIIKWRIK